MHKSAIGFDLNKIFSIQEYRVVQNDGVVQHNKQLFQITKNRIYAQPKSKVLVCIDLDGNISLWAKNVKLEYELIMQRKDQETPSPLTPYKQPPAPQPASRAWAAGRYATYLIKQRYEKREAPMTP